MMKLTAYGKTDVGRVRSRNQDYCYYSEENGLFIVADGMGGHAAGEVASEMAVSLCCEQILPRLQGGSLDDAEIDSLLADSVREANRAIERAAGKNPDWKGMGTTLTILLLGPELAHLAHVGDSRLYRFHNGRLEQISDDHSLVEDQLRRGIISQPEAASSNLRNVLLQAVGVVPELDICQKNRPVAEKDRFLLCSDGLTGMLSDQRISEILRVNRDLNQAGDLLIDEANKAGGNDNIAVVLVQVDQL